MNRSAQDRDAGAHAREVEPMGAFLSAAHALEARLEDSLASVGLSLAKYGVLDTLFSAAQPMALSELAAAQRCVRSNITQLVDRLEADGLVRRVADPSDRRSVRAVLTPQGEEQQAEGAKRIAEIREGFAASLPPADLATLNRLFEALG
jgi:DNA-binding MarR family transcriptional regulator